MESRRGADPLIRLRKHIGQRDAWDDELDADWLSICDAEVKDCVRRAEEKPPPELGRMFTDVYEEQPWHLREQQLQCESGPRAADSEDES